MTSFRIALLFASLSSLLPSRVGAQTVCVDGRVATAMSNGHCCWPGQRWNEQYDRCAGAPQCPAGWAGEGSNCLRTANAPPVQPPETVPPVSISPVSVSPVSALPGSVPLSPDAYQAPFIRSSRASSAPFAPMPASVERPMPHETASSSPEGYGFAAEIGAGGGFAWTSGSPSYIEFQDYTADTIDNPTCGYPRNDMEPSSPGRLVCPRSLSPGFAATGIFSVGVRVNLVSRIGLGLNLRFQPDAARNCTATEAMSSNSGCVAPNTRAAGVSPLSNVVFGVRVFVNLLGDTWRRKDLNVAAFVGVGGGQIHARPGLPSGTGEAAHIVSGNGNVHIGVHAEYGLSDHVHVGATITANVMIPTVLFVLDAQLILGLHF